MVKSKEELVKQIEELEAKVAELTKIKEQAVLNEFNLRKEKELETGKLNAKINALNDEIVGIKDSAKTFEEMKKLKEGAVLNEFNLRKEREGDLKQIEALKKEVDGLKGYLNKLAGLFDEFVSSLQDQNKLLASFTRNSQMIEKYLLGKVDEFNQGDKKK